ncbi:MAG: hypothetical protein HQL61_17255 [Magnetococcales bacterium]|nr:hypothetical protein [Nitrospirota bacterium]
MTDVCRVLLHPIVVIVVAPQSTVLKAVTSLPTVDWSVTDTLPTVNNSTL